MSGLEETDPESRETSLWQTSSTMQDALLSCDCDCVIEMEDMAVGVEEILQYAHAGRRREAETLPVGNRPREGASGLLRPPNGSDICR